jgi:hypothetical protein
LPAIAGIGFQHRCRGVKKGKAFLELCAGTCRVSNALSYIGCRAESFEITRNPQENILLEVNRTSLKRRIENGEIGGIFIGITCASFSRARNGKADYSGWPPPLRGEQPPEIYGLPNLSAADQERVHAGNRLADYVAAVLRLCILHDVAVILENPLTSRLWLYPSIQKLIQKAVSCDHFHACQFGAAWKKATRLVSWNIDVSSLCVKCKGKNCCRTGLPHLILSGTAPDGEFYTAKASAYPLPFCRHLAVLLSTKA